MDIEKFIQILKEVKSDRLFNPYTDLCELDKPNAPEIRINNLRLVLNQPFKKVLVGEAPGYMGARKTGIAFTSEHIFPLVREIWNVPGIEPATIKGNYQELSATHVWNVLPILKSPPLMWNMIPMHPFYDIPLSNRKPNKEDYLAAEKAIKYFFDNMEFTKIYSVGRVAELYLGKLGFKTEYIRHPSMGGSNKFKKFIINNFDHKEQISQSRASATGFLTCIGLNSENKQCSNGRRKGKRTCTFHPDFEPNEVEQPSQRSESLDDFF